MESAKKTLVLGASDNPARYSYRAVHMLKNHGHEVMPVGIRKGAVAGLPIHTDRPAAASRIRSGGDSAAQYLSSRQQLHPLFFLRFANKREP